MCNKIYKVKKVLAIVMMVLMFLVQSPVAIAIAQEITPQPEADLVLTASPTPPDIPDVPTISVTPPATPTPPDVPVIPTFGVPTAIPSNELTEEELAEEAEREKRREERRKQKELEEQQAALSEPSNGLGGNVGDTAIVTDDATNSASILTNGNSNLLGGSAALVGGATVVNQNNGSESSNSGSVSSSSTDNTNQTNGAIVVNNLDQSSTTGGNNSSKNVGNTSVETGDANTTATVVTSINTNVDGVMVAEFNIADDHTGDIVLDFGANCISGCGGNVNVLNSENGEDSENDASIDQNSETNTFQGNDATIENNITLLSDSGNNNTNKNTKGDNSIETGNANTTANILNFANNNIAGNVVFAVVNVYGDLIGDILMSEEELQNCCGGDTTVANNGNGEDSENSSSSEVSGETNINQFNNVDIENNLVFDANTGGNQTSSNTGGNNSIDTGDTTVFAQTVNIANMNLIGGNYWFVLVNEAGQWLGKIIGASDDATLAGTETMQFIVDENGEVMVVNSDNGSGSSNNASVAQDTTTNITQSNDAKIVNNVNLIANTGNNSASKNTGGDSSIKTGDATVVANIVNFVNNNIVGDGKLFVTVVNVFGSWLGDFVGPGQTQTPDPIAQENGTGGPSEQNNSSSNNAASGNNGNNNGQGGVAGVVEESLQNLAGRVLSFKTQTTGGGEIEISESEEETVQGETINTDVVVGGDTSKKLKINLAWTLLGIPLIGGFLIVKRKVKKNASLAS